MILLPLRQQLWIFLLNCWQIPPYHQIHGQNIRGDNFPQHHGVQRRKVKVEQSLGSTLTRFHKRKLEIQEKKIKANAAFTAGKQNPVTRNALKEMHSANNIVNNNVNIANLQKQISD